MRVIQVRESTARANQTAIQQMLRQNGQFLVTVQQGRILQVMPVPKTNGMTCQVVELEGQETVPVEAMPEGQDEEEIPVELDAEEPSPPASEPEAGAPRLTRSTRRI